MEELRSVALDFLDRAQAAIKKDGCIQPTAYIRVNQSIVIVPLWVMHRSRWPEAIKSVISEIGGDTVVVSGEGLMVYEEQKTAIPPKKHPDRKRAIGIFAAIPGRCGAILCPISEEETFGEPVFTKSSGLLKGIFP